MPLPASTVGLEFGPLEGAGADRAEVLLGAFRRLGAHAVLELRLLDDRCGGADEGAVGERLGDAEGDPDGELVERLDRGHVGEVGAGVAAALGMHAVVAREHHVGGGEGRAVRPHHAGFQLPGDRGQVGRDAAVLDRGDLGRQRRHHLAGLVVVGQRLEHQRRAFDVLGAAREIGVLDRRRLPVEDVELAVGAALGQRRRGQQGGRRRTDEKFFRCQHCCSPCFAERARDPRITGRFPAGIVHDANRAQRDFPWLTLRQCAFRVESRASPLTPPDGRRPCARPPALSTRAPPSGISPPPPGSGCGTRNRWAGSPGSAHHRSG